MARSREALSLEEKNRNQNELQIVLGLLLSLYGDNFKDKFNAELLPVVTEVLTERKILLSVPEGITALQRLLAGYLSKDVIDARELKAKLETVWVPYYLNLEEKASQDFKSRANQLPPGITQSLLRTGFADGKAWGDDNDVRMALKKVMTQPEDVTLGGTYVLPPVILVPGASAEEIEKQKPHLALQDRIATARNQIFPAPLDAVEQDTTLLIPVNCGESHWRAVEVTVKSDGKIEANLWDSIRHESLQSTAAFTNMKAAVTALDPHASLKTTAAGVQKNDYMCADHVAQRVVQKLPKDISDKAATLRDAKPAKLRDAFIAQIVENVPQINLQDSEIDEDVKGIFKKEIAESELENELHRTLSTLTEKGKSARQLQEQFDDILSKKLDELYRKNPKLDESKDKELLDTARRYAFAKLQERFGIFATKDNARKIGKDSKPEHSGHGPRRK